MRGETFPAVAELTPHRGAMRLLSEVVEHSPERTVCLVEPGRSALLADADGRIPVWVGLEYMAQCVAVHGGLVARSRGEARTPGLFLGSRRVRFCVQRLPERNLEVEARHRRGSLGLVVFDCCLRDPADGRVLVDGPVNVFRVERWEDLLKELRDDP